MIATTCFDQFLAAIKQFVLNKLGACAITAAPHLATAVPVIIAIL